MAYAVQECYYSIEKVLHSLVDGEGRLWCDSNFPRAKNFNFVFLLYMFNFCFWCYFFLFVFFQYRVEKIFREINNSIQEGSLVITLALKKLPVVLSRFTALTGLLVIIATLPLSFSFCASFLSFKKWWKHTVHNEKLMQ